MHTTDNAAPSRSPARRSRRALRGIASLALLTPFLSAPTPGNVGGCGGSLAATPIRGHEGNTNVNLESTYFERGLCAGFCQRLYECGLLCTALQNPPAGCGTTNDGDASALYQCVHGTGVLRSELFSGNLPNISVTSCPKTCPTGSSFAIGANGNPLVYEWDVQVCTDAVMARSCTQDVTDPGSIFTAFIAAPSECANANVCRTR